MLYELIRPISNITFRTLLRKINIVDEHRFPRDEPVILSSNHPTAFLEPCILACFLERPLYFMVRGDFFENPLYRKLMFGLHLIPIHRIEGGVANIRKNHEIFQYCFDALDSNHSILIMAEGKTRQHRRLGPLKKGTARLALGFVDAKDREDGLITPVGVNFSRADHWRTDVQVRVGEPFAIKDFMERYKEHPQKGYDALNRQIERSLRKVMFFVEEPEDDEDAEFMLTTNRLPYLRNWFPHSVSDTALFEETQALAEGFKGHPLRAAIGEEIAELKAQLKAHKVDWRHVDLLQGATSKALMTLVFGFPFFLLGWLTNAFSFWSARMIVKAKVRQVEFVGPVRAAVVLFFNLFLWPALILLALYLRSIPLLIVFLFSPLWGLLAAKYYDTWKNYRHTRRFLKMGRTKVEDFRKRWIELRDTLISHGRR